MTICKQCALTPILFVLSSSAIAAPRLDLSTTVSYPCVATSMALSNDALLASGGGVCSDGLGTGRG